MGLIATLTNKNTLRNITPVDVDEDGYITEVTALNFGSVEGVGGLNIKSIAEADVIEYEPGTAIFDPDSDSFKGRNSSGWVPLSPSSSSPEAKTASLYYSGSEVTCPLGEFTQVPYNFTDWITTGTLTDGNFVATEAGFYTVSASTLVKSSTIGVQIFQAALLVNGSVRSFFVDPGTYALNDNTTFSITKNIVLSVDDELSIQMYPTLEAKIQSGSQYVWCDITFIGT